ncbi:hypothetical protein BDA96_02G358300 [Sorghum bicolor]|uniref:Uncharacterized protein n=1 Tax=Sorghum bicolor TaxID=4558 RepID=A0A921RTZ1_SORBI|nr:hypothetical protein BDA96_02G358300 [Sorghum bicolor]
MDFLERQARPTTGEDNAELVLMCISSYCPTPDCSFQLQRLEIGWYLTYQAVHFDYYRSDCLTGMLIFPLPLNMHRD